MMMISGWTFYTRSNKSKKQGSLPLRLLLIDNNGEKIRVKPKTYPKQEDALGTYMKMKAIEKPSWVK